MCGRVSESRGELFVVFLRTMIRGECRGLIARVVGKSLDGELAVFLTAKMLSFCAAWSALKVSVEA